MQVGHKTAWSKGGSTNLRNSICLCYRCNKLQGTDSWATFLKKQGVKDKSKVLKEKLGNLTVSQLKVLAKKHNIKVKGKIEDDGWDTYRKAPTKKQYVSKLCEVVTEKEINSLPKEVKKRKKKRKSNSFWD